MFATHAEAIEHDECGPWGGLVENSVYAALKLDNEKLKLEVDYQIKLGAKSVSAWSDIVKRQDERLAEAVIFIADLKNSGTRFDMNPTQPFGDWEEVSRFYLDYIRLINDSVSNRADEILAKLKGGERD